MIDLDIGWLIGGAVALFGALMHFLKLRKAKNEGRAQGREEVAKEVKKADEKRATEIRGRVEAVRERHEEARAVDSGGNDADGVQPVPAKDRGKARGYRD